MKFDASLAPPNSQYSSRHRHWESGQATIETFVEGFIRAGGHIIHILRWWIVLRINAQKRHLKPTTILNFVDTTTCCGIISSMCKIT